MRHKVLHRTVVQECDIDRGLKPLKIYTIIKEGMGRRHISCVTFLSPVCLALFPEYSPVISLELLNTLVC